MDRHANRGYTGGVRIIGLSVLTLVLACVSPDLSTICPDKPITQGVFGEVVDSSNTLEENVTVDIYTTLNGMKDMMLATRTTTRGGYQVNLLPAPYILCSKTVCVTVTVPTGLVEQSAIDATSGLTWDAPVAVPPAQTIGPCKFGS